LSVSGGASMSLMSGDSLLLYIDGFERAGEVVGVEAREVPRRVGEYREGRTFGVLLRSEGDDFLE
jgi:hypothetical protein